MDICRNTISAREEEGIAAGITPDLGLIILLRVELLPNTGRVDMLVSLVPPAVDYLGKGGIIGSSL